MILVSSLSAVILVGVIAHIILLARFNQLLMRESFTHFRSDVSAYVTTYGSWQAGERSEPFNHFVLRRHAPGYSTGSSSAGMPRVPANGASAPWSEASGHAPAGLESRNPPFQFLLLDMRGRVLSGDPQQRGRQVSSELVGLAQPIVSRGKTIALALPVGKPRFSQIDLEYLQAVQQALFIGIIISGILSIAFGLFAGTRFSRRIDQLMVAVEAMGQGQLRQHLNVRSRDEIGALARAFNRMSSDLAQANEQLRASHDRIVEQAVQLKDLSIRDELTELYNRRHFDAQAAHNLAQALRYGQPLSIVMGDLDHFKEINDTFSHAIGDAVLRQVSLLIRDNSRESDVVARYGGEEFAIALPQTSLAQAIVHCQKLRAIIEAYPWDELRPGLRVTSSMGLCDDIKLGSAEKMVAAADGKLYEAKAAGRNCVRPQSAARFAAGPGNSQA